MLLSKETYTYVELYVFVQFDLNLFAGEVGDQDNKIAMQLSGQE